MRGAHSLTCHDNMKGGDPVPKACEPNDKVCMHMKVGDAITKGCSNAIMELKDKCLKATRNGTTMTTCFCDTDNCNEDCSPKDDCKPAAPAMRQIENSTPLPGETCTAVCKGEVDGGTPTEEPSKPVDTTQPEDAPTKHDKGPSKPSKTSGKSTVKSGSQGKKGSFNALLVIWTTAILLTLIGLN